MHDTQEIVGTTKMNKWWSKQEKLTSHMFLIMRTTCLLVQELLKAVKQGKNQFA